MKSTGVCPRCSSRELAGIPGKLGTYNAIKVDTFRSVNLTRYVCTSCGYMEQYGADDTSLLKFRRLGLVNQTQADSPDEYIHDNHSSR